MTHLGVNTVPFPGNDHQQAEKLLKEWDLLGAKAKGKTGKNEPIPLLPSARVNFMLAMLEAVMKDQTTLSQTEITDANSTELATTMETDIYQYWNGPDSPLESDLVEIQAWAGISPKDDPTAPGEAAYWQKKYAQDSAKAQSSESSQDGMVQSAQGQTSSDASNLQTKAQMVVGMNSIESALSNMLGRITA